MSEFVPESKVTFTKMKITIFFVNTAYERITRRIGIDGNC